MSIQEHLEAIVTTHMKVLNQCSIKSTKHGIDSIHNFLCINDTGMGPEIYQ